MILLATSSSLPLKSLVRDCIKENINENHLPLDVKSNIHQYLL